LRSYDGGDNWQCLKAAIPSLTELVISSTDLGRRLFVGAWGVHYSDDDGESWQECAGLPPNSFYWFLELCQADPLWLYAIDHNQRLWRSSDRGASWSEGQRPPGGLEIVNFIVDPNSALMLYAGIFQGGLFKSTDGGDSWYDIDDALPVDPEFIYPSGLAVNPQNSQNVVVYSSGRGMFMSNDGGQSWGAFNDGLPPYCNGGYAAFSPSDTTRIYFATLMASVWSIHRTVTGVDEDPALPSDYTLSAYPNPFNGQAEISFELPVPAYVSLAVYDLQGRRVTSLLAGEKRPAGINSLVWDAADLSSGLYFVRLVSGDAEQTIKITLVK
jgi:photosystem II stability/assembly factor-like uncharacterized protein